MPIAYFSQKAEKGKRAQLMVTGLDLLKKGEKEKNSIYHVGSAAVHLTSLDVFTVFPVANFNSLIFGTVQYFFVVKNIQQKIKEDIAMETPPDWELRDMGL